MSGMFMNDAAAPGMPPAGNPAPMAAPMAAPMGQPAQMQAPEGVRLYVGNLSFDTNEDRIVQTFSQFGSVLDVFLPVYRDSGRKRGLAFVTMATRESAEAAIRAMDNAELDGRVLKVNESRPKGAPPPGQDFNPSSEMKLYVGNLSFDTTQEQVNQLFAQYGTISDCFLPNDRQTGRPRGFAFVTMPATEAQNAIQMLNGFELNGRPIQCNQAQPKNGGGGFGGRGGYGGGFNGGFNGGGGYNQGYGGVPVAGYGGGGGGYAQGGFQGGY
mmetsp:Transcript_13439/g.27425  ORF Transcript_13439/g.27425 Transcript_13439/m.27425 type:complete len:270 (-) Transcript_13439:31-840(-)